jgi:predicted MPP superfamily phosphohydrolase
MNLTRRGFIMRGAGAISLGTLGLGGWTFVLEPGFLLDVTRYSVTPPKWPAGLELKIAVIADVHACDPWMPAARIQRICEAVNALKPDVIVLLGDYYGGTDVMTQAVHPDEWGEAFSTLRAPHGVFGVLGNHDIWHGPLPNMPGDDGETVTRTLRHASVRVLDNQSVRLVKDGIGFWMMGLADQMAHRISRGRFIGRDDLDGTLASVTDDAPAILLAHEPFIFPRVPERVSLSLCGHTHGGQVDLPIIGNPFLRKRLPREHVYGHVSEGGRNMIVSAGLGVSIIPARFMRPPEIVLVTLGTPAIA